MHESTRCHVPLAEEASERRTDVGQGAHQLHGPCTARGQRPGGGLGLRRGQRAEHVQPVDAGQCRLRGVPRGVQDRKSTRLNSSHLVISYAVFCLKKKKSTTSRL